MATPLRSTLTPQGVEQGDLVRLQQNIRDVVNELQADHATYKTLGDELIVDHATFKAVVDDLKAVVNWLRYNQLYRTVGTPDAAFGIDTNFDVKNTEVITYLHNGALQTLADNTSCDTGTAKTIAANQWAALLITGDGAAALAGTWTADAASEAAALTLAKALALAEVTDTVLGVVTVKTATDAAWIAGTSALKTGTGGDVASETNYYNFGAVVQGAVSSSAPATLSASTPATLTNITPLTLNQG